jgi:hypothetical protein
MSAAQGTIPHEGLMSAATKTPATPGAERAACVSMRVMRACAYGLRTNAAWSVPVRRRSST